MYGISDFATEFEEIHYSPGYISELEHKIKFLEKENNSLTEYKLESERLKLELQQMNELKDAYEEKYDEANLKLLFIDDDSMIFSESEQIKTLNQKIIVLLHANEDLRKEIEENKVFTKEILNERDELLTKNTQLENLVKELRILNNSTKGSEIISENKIDERNK